MRNTKSYSAVYRARSHSAFDLDTLQAALRSLVRLNRHVEAVEKPLFASFASARDGAEAIASRLTQKIVRLFVTKQCA